MPFLSCISVVVWCLCAGFLTGRANAQSQASGGESGPLDTAVVSDQVREAHVVHVSPHQLVFDAQTRTATLTFRNTGEQPARGLVQVVFGYRMWPHSLPADTILFTPHYELIAPRDTIIAHPGPEDPFAGRWLTGLPTAVTLAPHETKQVTLRLDPPATVPAGMYWARIVTIVRPADPKHGNSRDVQQHYAMPTKGHTVLPELRDSAEVIYRKGPLRMGLEVGPGVGAIAPAELPSPTYQGGPVDPKLWYRFPVHLTGNVPFIGISHTWYQDAATGEVVSDLGAWEMTVYHDAVVHIWAQVNQLPPGKYILVKTLTGVPLDAPDSPGATMAPVTLTIPFEVK